MNPILGEALGLAVPAYPLALALGVCLLVAIVDRRAAERALPGHRVAAALVVAYASGLLGARVLFVLEEASGPRDAMAMVLNPSVGGLSSMGGFVFGSLGGVLAAWRLDLPLPALLSAAPLGLCVGAAVGRIGCYLAGCCYGSPTALPWGVLYPAGSSPAEAWSAATPLHPTPLYEATALLLLALAFARSEPNASGDRTWLRMVMAYSVLRLLTDSTRGDVTRYDGLSLAQWVAAAVVLLGLVAFAARGRQAHRPSLIAE